MHIIDVDASNRESSGSDQELVEHVTSYAQETRITTLYHVRLVQIALDQRKDSAQLL